MATPTAGYSGTPLAKKLGIKPGSRVFVANAPAHYRGLLDPLPEGVTFAAGVDPSTDLAHLFVTRADELGQRLAECRRAMGDAAAVWVSWPKKASRVPTDVTEDLVRRLAVPLGFVDVKVCAVDEVWSGLKLVVRRLCRAGVASSED